MKSMLISQNLPSQRGAKDGMPRTRGGRSGIGGGTCTTRFRRMWAVSLARARPQMEAVEDESGIEAEHEAELVEAQVHQHLLGHPQD